MLGAFLRDGPLVGAADLVSTLVFSVAITSPVVPCLMGVWLEEVFNKLEFRSYVSWNRGVF